MRKSENADTSLRDRWSMLCERVNIAVGVGELFEELFTAYSEPHRRYHNLSHIDSCLSIFDTNRQYASNRDLIEISIWFHDVVYDVQRKDNEVKSAHYATDKLRSYGLNDADLGAIYGLILATDHRLLQHSSDEMLIADC